MARTITIGCMLLCCASLVWAMRSERHAPWRAYQRQYVQVLRDKTGIAAGAPGILEVRTQAFGVTRADRCMTCHVALADSRFTGQAQPLSHHPAVDGHPDPTTMACTLCHLGNGRMLTAPAGHGIDPPAAEPLLDLHYIQAGCMRCHEMKDVERIAPKAAAGRRLFQTVGCFGCHTIEGLSKGSVGPDLTEVARRRTASYMRSILTEPTMNNVHSPMPPTDPGRSEDLDSLVTFLLTLRGARQPYVYQQ